MKSWINKLLADAQGNPSEAIVLTILSWFVFLGLEIYQVHKGTAFDMQTFGIGVGLMVTAMGAAIKLSK